MLSETFTELDFTIQLFFGIALVLVLLSLEKSTSGSRSFSEVLCIETVLSANNFSLFANCYWRRCGLPTNVLGCSPEALFCARKLQLVDQVVGSAACAGLVLLYYP
jgi:hypothetical protein